MWVALLGLASAMAASVVVERDASACGGCFVPLPPPNEVESVITDERMIFSISKDQTTLYDQIQYSGAPSSFAWVLPIKGTVTVGLSADITFNLIDQNLTASQVVQPPLDCPPPPTCGSGFYSEAPVASGGTVDLASDAGAESVVVTAQEQVGPYETVQLHSSDGSALTNWLTSHGYPIAADVAPVIAAYVADQFDFLALKLVPGKGVQSMQPVRVTSKGAALSLPLRMVAVGTGAKTGISIWVVSDGRWEPQNFPFFTITDSELTWDWTSENGINGGSSNYETVRLRKENALKGRGWQIESSLELNQFTIEQELSGAIQSNSYSSSPVGGYLSSGEPSAADAGADSAAPVEGGSLGTVSDAASNADSGDTGAEFEAGSVQAQQLAASQDLEVLFAGIAGSSVRITRMRSDVVHSALTVDMVLQASADQSELTNLHYPANQTGQPVCPVYNGNCEQTGLLPRDQAIAAANGTNRSGGCTASRWGGGSWTSTAVALGLIGFGAIRIRRRGRRG
jgi:hypothetical protein